MFAYKNRIPHWVAHALIGILIQLVITGMFILFVNTIAALLAGTFAGSFFYIGREVRDREKEGYWDWAGMFSPVITLIIIYAWLSLL